MKSISILIKLSILYIILFTSTSFAQIVGNAMEFDGFDDFIFVGNDTTLQVNQYTLTAWVNPYSYSGPLPNESRMEILEKRDEYWMNISTITHPPSNRNPRGKGEVRVGGYFGPDNKHHSVDSEYIVPLNEWTHVACVYDLDSLKLYINGQYEAAVAIPEGYSSQQDLNNDLGLGCKTYGPGEKIEAQFHGMLDEISIWDTAFSVIDIQEIMNSGIENTHPNWDRLIAYYKFDEDKIGQNSGLVYDEKGLNDGDNYGAYWVSATPTDVAQDFPKATEYRLSQNYPNPFNPTTKINFTIPEAEMVSVKVFNVIGEEVAKLVNEHMYAGIYELNFDASNLNSGVYVYQITAGSFTSYKKMILLK